MRLRSRRTPPSHVEPSQPIVVADDEVASTSTISWSVEQLNALGPVIGPSHRTFVPIVRSTPNISLGDPINSLALDYSIDSQLQTPLGD